MAQLSIKTPRYIKGYPERVRKLARRLKRGAVRRELLRQERPRRFAGQRGTTYDTDAMLEQQAQQGILGSLEERIFYKALVTRGFIPDVDFSFQASEFGGRTELGGLVADFMFPYPRVVVQVQSYWHTITSAVEARDEAQQALLNSLGYVVLYVWPNTIRDQAALDLWMDKNVSHLWGTSTSPLGGASTAVMAVRTWGARDMEDFIALEARVLNIELARQMEDAQQRLTNLEGAIYSVQSPAMRVASMNLAAELTSVDYAPGSAGWKIARSGAAEFQNVVARGTIYAAAGVIEGVLTVGAAGGIYQGTGTFGSPTTGLKIYQSSGIGLLEMWGSGAKQAYFSTDGKLYCGAGKVTLDANGILMDASASETKYVKWLSGAVEVGSISSLLNTTLASMTLYAESATKHATLGIYALAPSTKDAHVVLTALSDTHTSAYLNLVSGAAGYASLAAGGDIAFSVATVDRLTVNATGALLIDTLTFGNGLGSNDVAISRGAANRLDLASGDSLNIVSGNLMYEGVVLPKFLAYCSSTQADVTGDGTAYTCAFDSEIYDDGGNFASNIFTAPIAGRYLLSANVRITGILSAHTAGYVQIVTSNRNHIGMYVNPYASGCTVLQCNTIADMDAGDTAYVQLVVSNGTKVVDMVGAASANTNTRFTGAKLP